MMCFNLAVTRFGVSALFVGALWAIFAMTAPAVRAESIRIAGTGAAQGLMPLLAEAYRAARPDIEIDLLPHSLGSKGGISALSDGVIDIALSVRPLKEDETAAGLAAIPLGTTPLAFVTSKRDAAQGLTSAEVLAIYRLETKTWPDGTSIRIVLRPEFESDNAILIRSFGGMGDALRRLRALQSLPTAITDQDNLDLAERMPGSLTASALAAVLSEKRNLRLFALDGVTPTTENLANRTYPLVKTLYGVIKSGAPQPVLDFIVFVQSAPGGAILLKNGVLPASR